MAGKLQQVKSLLSSSSVNDLRVIDFELTSKIRSSVVLTSKDLYEQFLAKKLHRNSLSESFFPSKIAIWWAQMDCLEVWFGHLAELADPNYLIGWITIRCSGRGNHCSPSDHIGTMAIENLWSFKVSG